jgi:hypothetical protein
MTSSVEAAQDAALGPIDRAQPLLLAVRVVGPPTVEAPPTIAARDIGLEMVSHALWSSEHGEVTTDAVASARVAGEVGGFPLVGADEVAARFLGRLTRTAYGNQVGWSQEKK